MLRDLNTYPAWLDIVHRVRESADGTYAVDIGARLGPLTRSKRLTMVRTVDSPSLLQFERREPDGRDHSPWVLTTRVADTAGIRRVTVELFYGGARWVPLLDRIMASEIDRSKRRFVKLVESDDKA